MRADALRRLRERRANRAGVFAPDAKLAVQRRGDAVFPVVHQRARDVLVRGGQHASVTANQRQGRRQKATPCLRDARADLGSRSLEDLFHVQRGESFSTKSQPPFTA